MEGLLIDTFRVILRYLDLAELCHAATVSKQWCLEVNSPSLWRDLFLAEYKPSAPGDATFLESVRNSTVPQILNDWKRAYMIKIRCKTSQERINCLSHCMVIAEHTTPLLDHHNLKPFAHQPLMFESFATTVVEYNQPPSTHHKRAANNDQGCPGLFEQIRNQLGEDYSRAWMVIDASRSDQVTKVLGFINTAVYTTLLGSFFNVANVNNFPYLVKIDSYPNFCQHFVDQSGGNWGYIFVEHPSLKSHLDNVWYLNIDPSLYPTKEMKTMAFLRRHFMKFNTWHKDFFRAGELQNIIMTLHVYEKSVRDELFYEILTSPISNFPIKTPVVDYYILVDDKQKYLQEKIAKIYSDFVPSKINLNGKKDQPGLLNEYVTYQFLLKAEASLKTVVKVDPDVDLMPELKILCDQAQARGFVTEHEVFNYFKWHYTFPKFTEHEVIKDILANKNNQSGSERVRLINEIIDELLMTAKPEVSE